MKHLIIATLITFISISSSSAYAKICYTLPEKDGLHDDEVQNIWNCKRSEYLEMWKRFHMSKHNWDDGFGFHNPCDIRRPLARTFNALYLLKYLGGDNPVCNTNSLHNMLPWAYCYAGNSIDELDAECWDRPNLPPFARTNIGIFVDNYTNLYYPFFYERNAIERASTIVHEARHAEGECLHLSCCPNGGKSCDRNYYNGCTGSRKSYGIGANGIHVAYLQHVALFGKRFTTWQRKSAIDLANDYIQNRFCDRPSFSLNKNTGKLVDDKNRPMYSGTLGISLF